MTTSYRMKIAEEKDENGFVAFFMDEMTRLYLASKKNRRKW